MQKTPGHEKVGNGGGIVANDKVTWIPAREFLGSQFLQEHQPIQLPTTPSPCGSCNGEEEKRPSYIGVSLLANGYRLRSRTPGAPRSRDSIRSGISSACSKPQLPLSSPARTKANGGEQNANGYHNGVKECNVKLNKNGVYTFHLPDFSVDEKLTDGLTYKKLLNDVITLLNSHLAKLGDVLARETDLSESIAEEIRVTIGRTELLLNKRLRQFASQLERHLNPIAGEKPTKLTDLHGLFSLVDMQLADIKKCFDRIERASVNNWT